MQGAGGRVREDGEGDDRRAGSVAGVLGCWGGAHLYEHSADHRALTEKSESRFWNNPTQKPRVKNNIFESYSKTHFVTS